MESNFVSVNDFARLTSLGERSIRRMIACSRLPAVKVGRRLLVPLADALEALRSEGERRRG